MNRHASMNRIFRLVWNESLHAFVPAAETARGRGKSSRRRRIAAALRGAAARGAALIGAAVTLSTGIAQAGPTGGQISAGTGSISTSGSTTTIQQSSQNLSLNWQSFNIAPQQTVDFIQPNAAAIAVNRILDPNGSVILGHLNANGQVYLINPNGVLFGKGAEVNVGGLVASTLNLGLDPVAGAGTGGGTNAETFSGSGAGRVDNAGTLTAAPGGSIALLGNHVSNTGVIAAQLGAVALGAGSAATLTFQGSRLVSLQIDNSVLNSVAANGGLIRADGGTVLMSAGAQKSLLASVVNNTGVIEARSLENHGGTITLLGGMTAGTVNVGGTLDASAPSAGNGGSIETSAEHVEIAGAAKVTTAAAMGLSGSWLIDPTDFTIAASGGDITGATLSAELAGGSVSISSSSGTHGGSAGNINVNDAVTWNGHLLTLTATNDVNINAVLTATNTASLDLEPGSGKVNVGISPTTGAFLGQVNFFQSDGTTPRAGTGFLTIAGAPYTVITALGAFGSTTGTDLQGINGNLAGHFALGSDIDASVTATQGFSTIGSYTIFPNTGAISSTTPFTGVFDGLGHTVGNLTFNQQYTEGDGLFGLIGSTAIVRNVGVIAGSFTGSQSVGLIAGRNFGSIYNTYATGTSTAVEFNDGVPCAGGLVGLNYGTISTSYAAVTVSGTTNAGGLVGNNQGTISDSHATGTVNVADGFSRRNVGGLVGGNYSGSINNSYATGDVTSGANVHEVGGLVGSTEGILSNSFYNADQVSINGSHQVTLGGLYNAQYSDWFTHGLTLNIANYAGVLPPGTGGYYNVGSAQAFEDMLGFSESNAAFNFRLTANINLPAGLWVPYFAGSFDGAGFTLSNPSVSVPSNSNIGLFGYLPSSSTAIANVHVSNGSVTGLDDVGGLVGNATTGVSISNSSFAGSVVGEEYVGGLVGMNRGSITGGSTTGTVTGTGSYPAGGLVGVNYGTITQSRSSGVVTSGGYAGGLVGGNYGSISTSYATGAVSGGYYGGGLVGINGGSISNSYASGAVSGAYGAGGLVGGMWSGSIDKSYAYGAVTGGGAVGGLLGPGGGGTVTNSFYNSTANPTLTGIAGSADAAGTVAGLSSSQLRAPASFAPAGWDLTNVWIVYPGNTNPLLRAFMTPLVIGGGVTTQTYDGIPFAPGANALNYSVTPDPSLLLGTVSVSGSAANAVHAGTYTYTPGGLYSSQLGYIISYAPSGLTINPASLTVSGTVVEGKTYNGSASASLTGGTLVGVLGGDTVTLTQAGSFATKNAGTGIVVSANDSLGGASAGDYTLVEPTGLTGTITPAPLTVNGTTVGNKVYNGTTTASLAGGMLVGVVTGDSVTLNQSGTFASAAAGTGIAVTATDSLGGAGAANYALVEPTGLTGTILPAATSPGGSGGSGGSSGSGGAGGPGVPSAPSAPSAPSGAVLAAQQAAAALEESFIYPQLGANPQAIDASPTIADIAGPVGANATTAESIGSHKAIAVNVSMKIGANGTLKIENGGLRLPGNLVVGETSGSAQPSGDGQ